MRYVYLFHEGNAGMKELLGGKGANLAEMTNLGLPVPPGLIVTTDACRDYYRDGKRLPEGLDEEVARNLRALEEETGKRFGDPHQPLLLSVRSGAVFSMPGMMDTVLNLGLNPATFRALAENTGNEWFARDTPTAVSFRCLPTWSWKSPRTSLRPSFRSARTRRACGWIRS